MGVTKYLEKLTVLLHLDPAALRIAKKFVLDFANEDNSNPRTNGEFAFIRRNAGRFDRVFDVGANTGEWTRFVLAACEEKGARTTIHAFEPGHATFAALSRNAFPSNVRLVNAGLWSSPGKKTFHVIAEDSEGNSIFQRDSADSLAPTRVETIEVETVDGYCLKEGISQVDFMKVDVEGSELEVLKGAARMLAEGRIQAAQIEYGGTWIDARIYLKDLFDFLKAFPLYGVHKLHPNETRAIPRYDPKLDNFHYANYLIIKKDAGIR